MKDELGIDDYFDLPRTGKPPMGLKKKIIARNGRLKKEAEIAKITLSKRAQYIVNLAHIFEGETDEEFTDAYIKDLPTSKFVLPSAAQKVDAKASPAPKVDTTSAG